MIDYDELDEMDRELEERARALERELLNPPRPTQTSDGDNVVPLERQLEPWDWHNEQFLHFVVEFADGRSITFGLGHSCLSWAYDQEPTAVRASFTFGDKVLKTYTATDLKRMFILRRRPRS